MCDQPALVDDGRRHPGPGGRQLSRGAEWFLLESWVHAWSAWLVVVHHRVVRVVQGRRVVRVVCGRRVVHGSRRGRCVL